ncbi:hypothetical protein [Aeromonas veronii]|nr:hypothetical protein [Aeromonas veronii]MBL0615321.1 hypothetical protein [Aeromonas veronii]
MNGKLDSAYSHHAACRMQQRVHYLVQQGGEIVTVGHKTTHFKRDRH